MVAQKALYGRRLHVRGCTCAAGPEARHVVIRAPAIAFFAGSTDRQLWRLVNLNLNLK